MISTNKISKKYKDNLILNEVSLVLPESGCVFIVGRSGSGKSTFLNIISGLDKPSSGTIEINGKNLSSYNWNKWIKIRSKDITYVMQDYHLVEDKTIYENIKLSFINQYNCDEAEINSILKKVGLIGYKYKKVNELSGGQKQRVALVRGILNPKKILILDEPTKGLDSNNSDIIYDLCKELSSERLILIVTHEISSALKYGDVIYELIEKSFVNFKNVEISNNIKNNSIEKSLDQSIRNIFLISDNVNNQDEMIIIRKNNHYYIYSNNRHMNISVKSLDDLDDNHESITKVMRNQNQLMENRDDSQRNIKKIKSKDNKFISLTRFIFTLGMFLGLVFTAFIGIIIPDDKYISAPKNINQLHFDLNANISMYDFYIETYGYLDVIIGFKGNRISIDVPNNRDVYISNIVVYPLDIFDEQNIIVGSTLLNRKEIIIDIGILDNYLNRDILYGIGVRNYLDLIDQNIFIGNNEYTIVGVSNYNQNIIFMDNQNIIESYGFPVRPLSELYSENFTIIEGNMDEYSDSIMYAYTNRNDLNIGDQIDLNYLNYNFTVQISALIDVVGVENELLIVSNSNYIELLLKTSIADIYLITDDWETLSNIENRGIIVSNLYEIEVNNIRNSYGVNLLILELALVVLVVISLLILLYMSYLINVSEYDLIGVKLLLGYSRIRAFKQTLSKILYMIVTNVIGYIIGFAVIILIDSNTTSNLIHVNYDFLLNVFILVCVITLNLIVAFLPQIKLIYTKPIEYLRIKNIGGLS